MANRSAAKSSTLEDRVENLEKTLWKLGVLGAAIGVGLTAFLGFTWTEIPDRARQALANAPAAEAEQVAKRAATEAENAAKNAQQASARAVAAANNLPKVPVEHDRSSILSRLERASIETHVQLLDSDGGGSHSYSCPEGMKVLSCVEVLISSGEKVCGPTINANRTSCSYGGCNHVPGQKWRLTIVCGRIRV